MQHHRLPTRLLDWSESPLAALYFAVTDPNVSDKDGSLWCLLPTALNKESGMTFDHNLEIPAFGTDQDLDGYLPSKLAAESRSSLQPIAVLSVRNSARITAQQGVFTVHHRDPEAINKLGAKKHVWQYKIPTESKEPIRNELSNLGVNALSLFPDLDQVAIKATEAFR